MTVFKHEKKNDSGELKQGLDKLVRLVTILLFRERDSLAFWQWQVLEMPMNAPTPMKHFQLQEVSPTPPGQSINQLLQEVTATPRVMYDTEHIFSEDGKGL